MKKNNLIVKSFLLPLLMCACNKPDDIPQEIKDIQAKLDRVEEFVSLGIRSKDFDGVFSNLQQLWNEYNSKLEDDLKEKLNTEIEKIFSNADLKKRIFDRAILFNTLIDVSRELQFTPKEFFDTAVEKMKFCHDFMTVCDKVCDEHKDDKVGEFSVEKICHYDDRELEFYFSMNQLNIPRNNPILAIGREYIVDHDVHDSIFVLLHTGHETLKQKSALIKISHTYDGHVITQVIFSQYECEIAEREQILQFSKTLKEKIKKRLHKQS